MVFNSLNDLKSYVEKKHKQTIKVIAEKEQRILRDEVMSQVYEVYSPNWYTRTWALYNNIQYTINGNSVSLKLANNRNWHSVYSGEEVYALATLDAGTTWARGGTNVQEKTLNRVSKELPKVYKTTMNNLGVPVK